MVLQAMVPDTVPNPTVRQAFADRDGKDQKYSYTISTFLSITCDKKVQEKSY